MSEEEEEEEAAITCQQVTALVYVHTSKREGHSGDGENKGLLIPVHF